MKRVKLMALVALFGFSFVACTTEDSVGTDASVEATTIDEAQASNLSDLVISTADDYIYEFENNGYKVSNGMQKVGANTPTDTVIITVDKTGLTVFPKKICVDFGSGFTDKRGNILKGKLYLTISNKMTIVGSTKKVEFSNFFINDNQLKGSKTITFNGIKDLNPSWSISVKDTVVRKDGTKVIWNSDRVRTRITNATLLIAADDTISITGSSNGVNAKNIPFTMTITKPLVLVPGYKFFVSGSVVTATENRNVLLDYGNGEKDAKATITYNEVTKVIDLKK